MSKYIHTHRHTRSRTVQLKYQKVNYSTPQWLIISIEFFLYSLQPSFSFYSLSQHRTGSMPVKTIKQSIVCLIFFFFEYFILSCSRYISTELLAYSYYLYFALLLLLCILSFNSFKHKTRAPVIIVISIIFTCINSIAILLIAKQLLLVVQYFFFFILLLLQLVSAIHRSFFQWI